MAKALVIVESPAKAKTINKYLGKQYVVKASLGHIKDLPKRDLAVDVDHGFRPKYEVIEGKKKLMGELRQASKKVDSVYLAADPDPPCAASVDFGASGRAQTGGDHDTLTTNSPRFVAPYWPSGYKGRRSDLVSSHTRGAARSSRWPRDFVPMRDRPALPPG